MKRWLLFILCVVMRPHAYAQEADTLRVLLFTPADAVVDKDCKAEYAAKQEKLVAKRAQFKIIMQNEKDENKEAFDMMPWYSKQMYANRMQFVDSLTAERELIYNVADYLEHRLGKPFKIKPRLVMLDSHTLAANTGAYEKTARKIGAAFIVNIPQLHVYKSKEGVLMVKATMQVYSRKIGKLLLDSEMTGDTHSKEGYDIMICQEGTLDCALTNAVYENTLNALKVIVTEWTGKEPGW